MPDKASSKRVNPEYLDPYLYIKAQIAQFRVSCHVPESNEASRYLIPLGTANDTEDIILGYITLDHCPRQLPQGEPGGLDFIGISYVEVGYYPSSGQPEVYALCVKLVNGKPGVFERLGVARILKDVWDRTAQFDENIILG
ncbi:uncharacterized protein J4E88_010416 [Alternaria novae-zelandiae]|uniref:uncharacterized protein n=1 Tax=Alternaria novae-zelandiae TaxID=430562 RepID=UPI0020C34057|nr:uncharacterized protein J4E88_010416 [Alternaria novae-zelandiae]KAI4666848.1 hypothetical protein J4E88_010416 [Alternaria novae-zelandiae]